MEQVPAIGGASTDTLDDPSFTGHDVTPSLRQESSSEVLPDSPSQDLVSTPTAPPCESHPPAFFSPSQVLNDLTTESHDDHTSPPVSSHPVVSSTEVSPAPQEAVQELVEKLSAIAQQNGLVFEVSSLSQFVKNSEIRLQTSGPALD